MPACKHSGAGRALQRTTDHPPVLSSLEDPTLLTTPSTHPPTPQVGGYQLHHVDGAVGGAKGVGHAVGGGGGAAAAAADPKRKRDDSGTGGGGKGKEKELSKEDLEFLQRREAARQRVQQRTAATFGLS